MGTQDHDPTHHKPRHSTWAPWVWPVLALGVLGIAVPLAVEHAVPLPQAAPAAAAASPARSALIAQAAAPPHPDKAARCSAIADELLRADAAPLPLDDRAQHARDLHKARIFLRCDR